jgi:4-aminobutyrate aminotransferase / (S)-3-amino-2-methylpropionate transaminase / 5-aminovalerate transaminase
MTPGPKSRALAAALRQFESPNVTFVADDGSFPIFWEEAHGCTVTDADGQSYLDLTAAFGVASIGHTNPAVAAAIAAQAQKLIHGMGDVHPSRVKVALAQKLSERTPGDLGGALLGTSGGDAVEAALKTARVFTGKPGVVAFTGGYHGLNLGALAVTWRADFREPFAGQIAPFAVHKPYGEFLTELPDGVGAVLVEAIQGRGGIVVPPPGWLESLRALCEKSGAVLILDEIFTGWGRTGDWFACEHEGVVPDILCVGKALGGGLPISACLARPEVMAAWGVSTGEALHTSTFLGNPLCCAAALAALTELERLDAPALARERGAFFIEQLERLQSQFPTKIRGVRGRGLMLGIQLTGAFAGELMVKLLHRGVIVLPAGAGDILEFTPPFVISEEEIVHAVTQLELVLSE